MSGIPALCSASPREEQEQYTIHKERSGTVAPVDCDPLRVLSSRRCLKGVGDGTTGIHCAARVVGLGWDLIRLELILLEEKLFTIVSGP